MSVFVITAGHSDADPGAVSRDGVTEASVVLAARDSLAAILRARGHVVLTDGPINVNHPLSTAIGLVNRGALAVEFHTNSFSSPAATGVETISLPKHKVTSQKISAAIARSLGLRVRGDKGWIDQSASARGRLGFVSAGGLIVELFFLSNPNDYQAWLSRGDAALSAVADVLEGAVRG
jgi:N-acetylmuramoyl-L-alanine amidase